MDVLRLAENGQPGWAARSRLWLVMLSQKSAHHVLVDIHAKGQGNLLSNSGTTPGRITSFHLDDGIDYFLGRPFGPGRSLRWDEKSMRDFRFVSTRSRCSSVDGFRTIPHRSMRFG